MPILVKDFQWSQTEDEICLTLPLNNVNPKRISDIFITENFIKVNYAPYYFETFLAHSIRKDHSKCRILEKNIKFRLKKATSGEVWDRIESNDAGSKAGVEKIELKKSIFDANDTVVAEECKQRKQKAAELKNQVIDQEIKREQKIRKKVEDIQEMIKADEIDKVSVLIMTFWNEHLFLRLII